MRKGTHTPANQKDKRTFPLAGVNRKNKHTTFSHTLCFMLPAAQTEYLVLVETKVKAKNPKELFSAYA